MPGPLGDYPTRTTTSPFYSGYRAGLKFNDIFMQADSWSAEIKDEVIDLSTVNVYRNSGITTNLSVAYPAWDVAGTPMIFVNGGMRDTTFKIHGFHKDVANLPRFGSMVSLSLLIGNVLFFKSEQAIVYSASYNVNVKGTVEFNLELKATGTSTSTDTDTLPRF
jgi:hypothetical protein